MVSEYTGKGEYAALLWQADKRIKAEQDAKRAAWQAERARIEAADELVAEVGRVAHRLLTHELTAAGYHQHKRQWRRRRD